MSKVIRAFSIITLAVVSLSACSQPEPAAEPNAEPMIEQGPVEAAVYSVRGVVQGLPPAEAADRWVSVRHEAISDFIGVDGELDPMGSMTMTFPAAQDVDLSAMTVGDKVRFDLEIDWMAGDPAVVLTIEALPAETELDFGAAH